MYLMSVHILNVVIIWAILALSLNFLQGTAGLWSLGHAGFFAIGAYTSAILVKEGWPWLLCLVAAAILPAFVALLYGIPTLRLRADYFATVSMGLGEITRHVVSNWQSVTNGPDGISAIPMANVFGLEIDRLLGSVALGLLFLVLTYFTLERFRKSGFGRVLRAARDDSEAAHALGKDTFRFQLKAFLISAAFAGVAGCLFANYYGFIHPGDFGMWVTFNSALIVMIGGNGNYSGTLIATIAFILAREGLRFIPLPPAIQGALQQILFGIMLIIITLRFPSGLLREKSSLNSPEQPLSQRVVGDQKV